ncbi:unnamed protein product [Nippostrongylus brasiliensis]|uniref:Helicase ATP-binding domain-containing protein n=1 Tax=Nippostrongylus brasiliensis TaxID=27835 RepID=A0A0N4YQK2_NIPBR|nr:unnamed protein product [Nippostrongylus brasiliensis]
MGLGKTLQTLCALALSVDNEMNSVVSLLSRLLVELRVAWNYVVLDEGHIMRNPKTVIWRAANELNSTSRLILSGTPVQNSPADLWALFTWLMPGYLGDERHFRAQFLRKILKCRSHKANEKDIQDGSEAIAQLHRLILPFIMRRLKSEVLRELPDKNVQDYKCQLSEEQRTIYKFIVDRCTTNRLQLSTKRGISPLHALMALRQLVDHPVLIHDVLSKLGAPEDIMKLIGGVGLNLTGADVVIFLDHDWNPMKDLQAIDRAHRIGQTRKVNVYRLITQGTVEDKVMSLHKFKQDTADALIGADNRSLQTMATDELMSMFVLDGEQPLKENGAPEAKRKRKAPSSESSAVNSDERWNLAELWDESQYEQQFDVSQFIKEAV